MREKYLLFADGTSTHTLKWAKELNKYFDLYVVTFSFFRDEFRQFLDDEKMTEFNMAMNVSGGNYAILKKTRDVVHVMNNVKPQYIHAHYVTSYGFVLSIASFFLKFKSKLILSAWGTDILVTPNKSFLYKLITKFALNHVNLITSDSSFMSEKICALSRQPVLTLPFGIEDFEENLLFEDKDTYLFFSNRSLTENYNIDEVIKFFFEQFSYEPRSRLVIANEGSEKEKLLELVAHYGIESSVRFVGFLNQDEQNAFYKAAQYFISIPTSDATSVSLLEAMAYGCVPIVSDLPANREWVTEGVNGYIYKPGMRKLNFVEKNREFFTRNRSIIKKRALWKNNIVEFLGSVKLMA